MKQTWGFALFSVALSAIVLISMFLGSIESGLPAFFCFVPVIFFMIAQTIKELSDRVTHLERALRDKQIDE